MVRHLACIMDGNRRWARKQGWMPWEGHREGVKAAERAIDFCLEKKIPYLTLYAFSLENFSRSGKELDVLFALFGRSVKQALTLGLKKNIRVRFVGDRRKFPQILRTSIEDIEEKTAHGKRLTVNVAFCYGGRDEIVATAQQLARKVKSGELLPQEISSDMFTTHSWLAGTPDPDLLVRTGGERRLSNFLLYHMAYTELYFLDTLWPDISQAHLNKAVDYFATRKRNFGS